MLSELKHDKARGADNVTVENYGQQLQENVRDLLAQELSDINASTEEPSMPPLIHFEPIMGFEFWHV